MTTINRILSIVLLGLCAGVLSLNAQVSRSAGGDYIQQHFDDATLRTIAEGWMNGEDSVKYLSAGLLFWELNDTVNADTCFKWYAGYNQLYTPYYEGWKAYITGEFGGAEDKFKDFEGYVRSGKISNKIGDVNFWMARIWDNTQNPDTRRMLERYERAIEDYRIFIGNQYYVSKYVLKALLCAASLSNSPGEQHDTIKAKAYYQQLVDDVDILTGGNLNDLPIAEVDVDDYAYAAYMYAFLCLNGKGWDEAEVLKYLDKSINANQYAEAYLEKGRIFFSKEGDTDAEQLAFENFQNAVSQDSTLAFAYYCLAYCYECGIGVDENRNEAIRLYRVAYQTAKKNVPQDLNTQELVEAAAKDLGFRLEQGNDVHPQGPSRQGIEDFLQNHNQTGNQPASSAEESGKQSK